MEGPTPVSALIHAATMVTAGVFLLIRLSFLFETQELLQLLVIIIGVGTAFLSAITAIFLYDVKRIIAYSTCSQLGYMVLACGCLQFNVAFFHLLNHAFFKALLFIAAGAIIHSVNDEQDIRRLSVVFLRSPFIFVVIFIGNFALMGLPFLSGFYSKDLIIEVLFLQTKLVSSVNIIFFLILLATAFTAIYSIRLSYFLFFREKVLIKNKIIFYSQPFIIFFSLLILACFSIVVGFIMYDYFAFTTPYFYTILNTTSNSFYFLENEFLP